MTLKKTAALTLFTIVFSIVFFPVRDVIFDAPLDTRLATVIKDYRYPETVTENAYIDFVALQRAEQQTLDDTISQLSLWRETYNIYKPEETLRLYTETNSIKFIGAAWLYGCWVTPTPTESACVQPHAFERTSLNKNTLILKRYERALHKKNFYADPLVDLSDDFVGAAFLYLASSSYYADKGNWDEALRRWSLQHSAIFRYINEGHYSLQVFTRLAQLYFSSLKTAERMLVNGMPPRYWPKIKEKTAHLFDVESHSTRILTQEVGFYHDQLQRYYRPLAHGVNISRLAHQWHHVPVNKLFNTMNLNGEEKLTEEGVTNTQTPDDVISALSRYLAGSDNDVHNLTFLNAIQNALTLGIKLKQADIFGDEAIQTWLAEQNERNPFTKSPYEYNAVFDCILFEDDKNQGACIFAPAFVAQSPVPDTQ